MSRLAVPGSVIELWCRFYVQDKGSRILVDPEELTVEIVDPEDNIISSYVYGIDDDIQKELDGVYRLFYRVPDDAIVSPSWKDRWIAIMDGTSIKVESAFSVIAGSKFTSSESGYLSDNTLYSVVFSTGVLLEDGTNLEEELVFIFVSKLDPMYATVEQIRTHYGPYVAGLSDLTISLVIHDASVIASALMPSKVMPSDPYQREVLEMAMNRFVVCMTARILLGEMLGSHGGSKRKRLGDLDVSYGPGKTGIWDDYADAKECTERWQLALQSMGMHIDRLPAVGMDRGGKSADRMDLGRTISPDLTEAMGANTSYYRLSRYGYLGKRPVWGWTPGDKRNRRAF